MASISRVSVAGNRLTVFTVVGEAKTDEVINQIVAFLTEEPTLLVLWDFTSGTMAGIPSKDLPLIVEKGKKFADARKGGRTAIVCSKEVDFGLSRMFQVFAELAKIPFEITVFRNLEEAREWLGVAEGG